MKKQNKRTGNHFDGTAYSPFCEEEGVTLWSPKHDYPIEEVWNTHRTIARLIVPRLRAFREYDEKHGVPPGIGSMDEWERILDKMIQAFELDSQDAGPTTEQEEKLFQESFDLFYKYYRNLWD